MDYYNEIKDFINYTPSNLKNISEYGIRCPYKKYKNKKFFDPNVTKHHLQKNIHEKNICVDSYTENPIFYKKP